MTNSRRKGARGERDLLALLGTLLGVPLRRRLGAARDGGADSLDVPGWCIEIKYAERWLAAYWSQAVRQAEQRRSRPVLFWRASRRPWRAFVDPHDLAPAIWPDRGGEPISMTVDQFACLVAQS